MKSNVPKIIIVKKDKKLLFTPRHDFFSLDAGALTDLTKRLMEAFGVGRAGNRITTKVQEVVEHCVRVGKVKLRGEFLYGVGDLQIVPRDRSSFSPVDKKIELVAPEEIDAALFESVRLGCSLSEDAAVSEAPGLLGFVRATEKIHATVEDRLNSLIRSGVLARTGEVVTLAHDTRSSRRFSRCRPEMKIG